MKIAHEFDNLNIVINNLSRFQTFSAPAPRSIPVSSLSSSFALCFYIADSRDFEQFFASVKAISNDPSIRSDTVLLEAHPNAQAYRFAMNPKATDFDEDDMLW